MGSEPDKPSNLDLSDYKSDWPLNRDKIQTLDSSTYSEVHEQDRRAAVVFLMTRGLHELLHEHPILD